MLEYLKVAPTYVFSYEYCEISKDTCFEEYLQTAASFTRKTKRLHIHQFSLITNQFNKFHHEKTWVFYQLGTFLTFDEHIKAITSKVSKTIYKMKMQKQSSV